MTLKNLSESRPFFVIEHTFREAAAVYGRSKTEGGRGRLGRNSRLTAAFAVLPTNEGGVIIGPT